MFFRVAALAIYETADTLALMQFFGWFVGWLLTSTEKRKKTHQTPPPPKTVAFILVGFKLVLSNSFSKKARTVAILQKYQGWFICGQRCMCKPRVFPIWPAKDSAGKPESDCFSCFAALILSSPVLQVYFVWTKSLGEFPICLCVHVICGRHCTWSAALELEALDTICWASVEREICLILSKVKESGGS